MPRVWLVYDDEADHYFVSLKDPGDLYPRYPVEMNNSLYRQIQAAETKYQKFQAAIEHWMDEADAGRLKRLSNG
jgi:hypothetical protein